MTDEEPRASAPDIVAGLGGTLSKGARVRAVAALVAGVSGAVFVAALWWTEPGSLPVPTQLAFGLLTLVCLAWAAYGTWLLRSRVPLFATDRVVAAWIGLTASVLVGGLLVGTVALRGTGTWGVVAAVASLVAVSTVLVVRAHARRTTLLRRERALSGDDPVPGAPR